MRYAFVMLLYLIISVGIIAQNNIVLTLEQCKDMAVKSNNDIKNSNLKMLAANAQKGEALAEYFPKVYISAFGYYAIDPILDIGIKDILGDNSYTNKIQEIIDKEAQTVGMNSTYKAFHRGAQASVSLFQPIFAGGRIVFGNQLADLGYKASQLQYNIQKRVSLEQVEEMYWQIVALEEKRNTLNELQLMLDTIHRDIMSANSAGLAVDNDVRRIEVKRNELLSGLIKIDNGVKLLKMNLFNTIGYSYNPYDRNDSLPYIDDISLEYKDVFCDMTEKFYMDEKTVALKQEETELLQIQVDANKLEKRMALGEALPQVMLGASYGYSYLTETGKWNGVAFVTVKVPITDWGKISKKMERLDYNIQMAENDKEFLSSQIELQIRQLWFNLNADWQVLQVANNNLATTRVSLNSAYDYFNAGLISVSELLKAQTDMQDAQEQYTDAVVSYRKSLQAYKNRTKSN